MREFNYSLIRKNKWDSEMLGLICAIYKETGKQEMYLKRRPEELEKLVKIAKIKSIEASNAIEGIVTTGTRIRQLALEKTTPKNRDEQEIAGYRDVLSIILESFDAIPITQNYILQLHRVLYSYMNNPVAGRTKTVQNYIAASYLCPSLSDSSIEGALRKLVASGELKREGKGKKHLLFKVEYFNNRITVDGFGINPGNLLLAMIESLLCCKKK